MTSEPLLRHRTQWLTESPGPHEERFFNSTLSMILSLISQRDLWLFTWVYWGEKTYRFSQGLVDIESELMLMTRYPKCHHGPPVRIEAYKAQVINGALAQVLPTVDSLCLLNYTMIISPSSWICSYMDLLSSGRWFFHLYGKSSYSSRKCQVQACDMPNLHTLPTKPR